MDVANNNQRGDHNGGLAKRRTVPYRERGGSALDVKSITLLFFSNHYFVASGETEEWKCMTFQ